MSFNLQHTIQNLQSLLLQKSLTISTAESCTGGLLAATLTELAGSSAYFKGSVVSYANSVKSEVLHVPQATLDQFGAVSEQTATAMLQGCEDLFHTDIAVAITGIAGPSGGSPQKPVGTVYIGVRYKANNIVERFNFSGSRTDIRNSTVVQAIKMIKENI